MRFTRQWVGPIQRGEKTQTLRRTVPPGVHVGAIVTASSRRSESPYFARLLIESVERVHVTNLTASDARREGGGTVRELRDALAALYPDADEVVRIRFKLIDVPDGSTND